MLAPSVDIKDILENDSSLELVFGTNLFIGSEPTEPANCVTIFDTPGRSQDVTLGNDSNYFYPSLQVRARNTDYTTGYGIINNIRNALHGITQRTLNGSTYQSIVCSSEPALLDWDDNRRARFFTNFECQRR